MVHALACTCAIACIKQRRLLVYKNQLQRNISWVNLNYFSLAQVLFKKRLGILTNTFQNNFDIDL